MEALAVFLGLFVLGALLAGPVGLVLAVVAMQRITRLRASLEDLQQENVRLTRKVVELSQAGSRRAPGAEPAAPAPQGVSQVRSEARAPAAAPQAPVESAPTGQVTADKVGPAEAAASAIATPEAAAPVAGAPEAAPPEAAPPVTVSPAPSADTASTPAPSAPEAREGVRVTVTPSEPASTPASKAAPSPEGGHTSPVAPPAGPSLETIGVWVASAFGGLFFLVAAVYAYRLAVEKGWIGAEVRYAGGLALGVAGLVAAELLWKRYRVPAAALAGAAIGGLYAALYAGHSVYHLVGVTPTFALMAGVTTVGVLLALRRDSQFVAVLGLLGGFLTPILLSTGENRALALFTYTALLDAGLLLVASQRGWWILAALAGPATFGLHLGWGDKFHTPDQVPMALASALGLALLFVVAAVRPRSSKGVAIASFGGLALAPFATLPWLGPVKAYGSLLYGETSRRLPLGDQDEVLAAICLVVLALLFHLGAAVRRWPWVAVGGAVVLLPALAVFAGGWADQDVVPLGWISVGLLGSASVAWLVAALAPPPPADTGTGSLPSLVGLGALGMVAASGLSALPVLFEADSTGFLLLVTLVLGVLSWLVACRPGPGWSPLVGVGIVGLAFFAALDFHEPLFLYQGLVLFLVFLLAPFVLERFPAGRGPMKGVAPWLASALVGPVLFLPLHEAWDATFTDAVIGFLPLLLGAGTLVAAVMVKDRLRDLSDRSLALYVAVSLIFACVAIPVQLENEWLTVGWAVEAAALAWLSTRMRHSGIVLLSMILFALVGVRLLLNWEVLDYHHVRGASLWNWTLYGYGIPAVAALAGGRWFQMRLDAMRSAGVPETDLAWTAWFPRFCAILGILLLFALVNLEVSHAFAEGENLALSGNTLAARMTRSISWALFGLGLLVVGVSKRWMRLFALIFLLLAALKVLVVDLSSLTGLARVGSLFGVAVVLFLAALALQRFVLRKDKEEAR